MGSDRYQKANVGKKKGWMVKVNDNYGGIRSILEFVSPHYLFYRLYIWGKLAPCFTKKPYCTVL